MVADHHPGPGRGEAVAGEHDPAAGTRGGPGCGRDVQGGRAQAQTHRDAGPGQLGGHRVPVAAEGHQRLSRDRARHDHGGRERCGRDRAQRLEGGQGGDGGPPVGGRPQPGVPTPGAPGIEPGLGLLDGDVIGKGPPEPLRGHVVGLLHHALAVPAARRARAHADAIVLGHRRERRADPPGAGADHRGHPVKAPPPGEPSQGAGDPVQAIDQVGLVLGLAQHRPPATGVGQGTDEQVRGLAPPPVLGRVGQLDPVPLGLIPGRVLDHRDRAALGRPARLAHRAQRLDPHLVGHPRIGP